MRTVLTEIGNKLDTATVIHQDNHGATSWINEVQGLRKVKYIGLKYFHDRESVTEQQVQVKFVPSADSVADPFTKALDGQEFDEHRDGILVISENATQ